MGTCPSSYHSIPDPERDIEIEEFLLNLPNPEVPNLENPDDQDDDWIERVKLQQKPWLE